MTIEVKTLILVLTSGGLAVLTRRSLKGLKSHGLYRLFAWIATVALILLNLEKWFVNPASVQQLLSWLLLLLSVVAVSFGSVSLYRGRPNASRGDASLIGVERTTKLVQAGAYRYIRHPIYSSFLFAALGILLKDVSWFSTFITSFVILTTVLAAKMEERENLQYFGEAYRYYMRRTKMFVPFLF